MSEALKNPHSQELTPEEQEHSSMPLKGFEWGRSDTICTLTIIAVLVIAYFPMVFLGRIPLDRDNITFFYPLLIGFKQSSLNGWNPYQLAGCSFVANPQAALFYPPNWIFFLLPVDSAFMLSTVGHYFLAGFGMYLLARFSRLSPLAALISAFVFCLGGYMSCRLLLRPLLLSAAWFPLVFLFFLYGHHRKLLLGHLLAGVCLSLQLLSGMPHNAVYSVLALGFFMLYRLMVEFFFRKKYRLWLGQMLKYCFFVGIGLLPAAVMILPTMELLPHTVRTQFGFTEATTSSLPWHWLPDIFIGGIRAQAAVDWQFLESNCYLSVVAVWLVVFAFIRHWHKGIFGFLPVWFSWESCSRWARTHLFFACSMIFPIWDFWEYLRWGAFLIFHPVFWLFRLSGWLCWQVMGLIHWRSLLFEEMTEGLPGREEESLAFWLPVVFSISFCLD